MRHLSFEKTAVLCTVALVGLMCVTPDASAQTFSRNIARLIDSGSILKVAAIAATCTFLGIKVLVSGENSL